MAVQPFGADTTTGQMPAVVEGRIAEIAAPHAGLSAVSRLVPAGTRSSWQLCGTTTATASTLQEIQWRTRDVARRDVRNVVLVFEGWTWDDVTKTELLNPNAMQIQAAIEVGGVIYPAFFSGVALATLAPGARLVSDPIPVTLTAGTTFWHRTFAKVSDGQKVSSNAYVSGNTRAGESREHGTGNKVLSGSLATYTGPPIGAVIPNVVLGEPLTKDEPVVAVLGDSITAGWNDDTDHTADQGFVTRALEGSVGFLKVGCTGEMAQYAKSPALAGRRRTMLAGATSIVYALGTNDIYAGGRSATQLRADVVADWLFFGSQGAKVFPCTIAPRTTSTDLWSSAANQSTMGSESHRLSYNDWLRDGAPLAAGTLAPVWPASGSVVRAGHVTHPVKQVFDVALAAETAQNSGKWKPAGRVVTDAAMTSGSGTLSSASGNFTSADLNKYVLVDGAASGGVLAGVIIAVTNSTTVNLSRNAAVTVSGARANVGPPTMDGTHPCGPLHAFMAGAVNPDALV